MQPPGCHLQQPLAHGEAARMASWSQLTPYQWLTQRGEPRLKHAEVQVRQLAVGRARTPLMG